MNYQLIDSDQKVMVTFHNFFSLIYTTLCTKLRHEEHLKIEKYLSSRFQVFD